MAQESRPPAGSGYHAVGIISVAGAAKTSSAKAEEAFWANRNTLDMLGSSLNELPRCKRSYPRPGSNGNSRRHVFPKDACLPPRWGQRGPVGRGGHIGAVRVDRKANKDDEEQ